MTTSPVLMVTFSLARPVDAKHANNRIDMVVNGCEPGMSAPLITITATFCARFSQTSKEYKQRLINVPGKGYAGNI
jgi:hypothetical protein